MPHHLPQLPGSQYAISQLLCQLLLKSQSHRRDVLFVMLSACVESGAIAAFSALDSLVFALHLVLLCITQKTIMVRCKYQQLTVTYCAFTQVLFEIMQKIVCFSQNVGSGLCSSTQLYVMSSQFFYISEFFTCIGNTQMHWIVENEKFKKSHFWSPRGRVPEASVLKRLILPSASICCSCPCNSLSSSLHSFASWGSAHVQGLASSDKPGKSQALQCTVKIDLPTRSMTVFTGMCSHCFY